MPEALIAAHARARTRGIPPPVELRHVMTPAEGQEVRMYVFEGKVEGGVGLVTVSRDGNEGELSPDDETELREDGSWADWGRGYTCGAKRLSRAVLTLCLRDTTWANWFVEDFGRDVIGHLPRIGWTLTEDQVARFIVDQSVADLNRLRRRVTKGG